MKSLMLSLLLVLLGNQATAVPLGCFDPANLRYEGAVRVPECWHGNEFQNPNTFEFGGAQLAYSREGGTNGTLYMSGYLRATDDGNPDNVRGGYFARLSIPTPAIEDDPEDLPLCSVVDSLADYDGQYLENMALVAATQRIGDMMWLHETSITPNPFVVLSAWAKYNQVVGNVSTLFTNNESRTALSHIWQVGPSAGTDRTSPWFCWKHSNFVFEIPRQWATNYAGGRWLALGNGDRDGVHLIHYDDGCCADAQHFTTCVGRYDVDNVRVGVHYGPGFALVKPAALIDNPPDGSNIDAVEACGWYQGHLVQHDWAEDYTDIDPYQDLTLFKEAAWVSDHNFNSYLDTGKQAIVCVVQVPTCQNWYGQCGDDPDACKSCIDACGVSNHAGFVSGQQGDRTPNMKLELWFFNPEDFRKVLAGTIEPWEPKAYARYDLTEIFYQTRSSNPSYPCWPSQWTDSNIKGGGVAYDIVNSTLYISEGMMWANPNDNGYRKYPGWHVFHLDEPTLPE